MKIILLQDIKGLARKFDIKEVKDGYARNFLFPKGLAKIATEQAIKELEAQKAAWSKEEEGMKNKLETLAKDLANQEFRFTLKTGKKGEVFGSVAKSDVKTQIYTDVNTDLHRYLQNLEIDLEKPIKTLGEHSIEVDLGRGVKTTIKVIIESLE